MTKYRELKCPYCGSNDIYEGFFGITCRDNDCRGNTEEEPYENFEEPEDEDY